MAILVGFAHELGVSDLEIQNFYALHWKRKVALTDERFYRWQFYDAPVNKELNFCVVAYDSNKKKIMGLMGLNKHPFSLEGEVKKGAELTTWIIAEEYQGLGLGVKTIHFIQAHFDIIAGMGVSQMALPIYMRSGFRYLKSIPRFIKVIAFDPIKDYAVYDSLALHLIKKWEVKRVEDFFIEAIDEPKLELLWQHLAKTNNCFFRDSAHLHWRYTNHPYFTYKQYYIRPKSKAQGLGAYVCLREELSVKAFKVLHVMDLFGDEDSILAAVHFIEQYAVEHQFDVIDFYCTSSAVYSFLMGQGWFSINDDACFQFPHLFHPVEMRTPASTSLIYWAKDGMNAMTNLSKLYITKQDADMDRPTGFTLS